MKVLVQRCKKAKVTVNNNIVGSIDKGMMILVGFTKGDSDKEIDYLINKILNLRIFDDEDGIMNRNIKQDGGSILSISQFTLYANTDKGNRPSYIEALESNKAKILYELFNEKLSKEIKVETGMFGEDMQVDFINDGPVTILLEREDKNV